MTRFLILTALTLVVGIATDADAQSQRSPAAPSQQQQPIFRHADVDTAWAAAQKSGRPVLAFITSENCFYCKKMIAETLSHPQIARANNERFETTVISNQRQPQLVEKLGVRAFPTTIVVRPDGSIASSVRGFVEPAKYAEQILMASQPPRRATRPQSRDVAQR